MFATEADLVRRSLWTLRSIARRERRLDPDARRLTEPGHKKWKAFAGGLHEGDFASLLIENNAALSPLALQPFARDLSEAAGARLIDQTLHEKPGLITASTASFLDAAAMAFGRQELSPARRSTFEPIRQDQRIVELPSTAARVAAMVAQPSAPLETYVTYVVADEDDAFLVGLAMLEFDRAAMPTIITLENLRRGAARFPTAFSRAVTLGGEEQIVEMFPAGAIQRVVTL